GTNHVRLEVERKKYWVSEESAALARGWMNAGHTSALKTPDDTLIFVGPVERERIHTDQTECMGCLSHCGFSSWKDHDDHSTGRLADPRSFCIQKTLQSIAHGGGVDDNLMFAGHGAYHFKQDPFYSNNFTPTVQQLIDRILAGD
ncbi:MAG: nitronate monooxygenase, partial [Sphingopyxis sp.]